MIRSPRFWLGAAAGVAGLWLLCRPSGPKAFTGGVLHTPKTLRRQGRLLRDQQSSWMYRGGQGSSR